MSAGADWADRLLAIGLAVREAVIRGRDLARDSQVVDRTAGDTIFAIDRRVEPLILAALESLPDDLLPFLLVCEGVGADGRRRFGALDAPLRYGVIIDPIDGTRGLMYDKRSAWFLAAASPVLNGELRLANSIASVMVELPTSKQGLADDYVFSGQDVRGHRRDLAGASVFAIDPQPSSETSLRHGYGQVASFFPGVKVLAAELMEQVAAATLGAISVEEASIFDDQYISTGGQFVELLAGRDRFCCDLRPIFYEILRRSGTPVAEGLCCHPYDMAGLSAVQAGGVLITDGFGRALDASFDVDALMHWCGYANADLRAAIEPVVQAWIRQRLGGS